MQGTDRHGYYKCPYFKVYINGHGPFTFLFDTGAAYTLVSSRVVEMARLPVVFDRDGQRDVVNLHAIRIGGATLRDVWAIHDDNFGVDGIIGFPAFGLTNFLFDFSNRQLIVSATPIELTHSFELSYESPFHVPTVPMTIGGRSVPVLIDTGDDAYGLELRGEELAGAAVTHAPVAAENVLNGATVQSTRVTTLSGPVILGPLRADSAVVAINNDLPIGDMGYDVLRQFRFEFEPKRRVVVFSPIAEGGRFLVPAKRGPGFSIAFDGSGRVSGVLAGSAAQAAGMAAQDQILTIDGKAPQFYTPRMWDERIETGTPLAVLWLHEGVQSEARLTIQELQ